jgi:CRP/FNR family cyclic AMP-dependent transcriptional regulator
MRKQTAERVLWMMLGKWTQTSAEASKIQFLKSLPFFQDLAPWQLKRVTEVVFERTYEENETLFEEGQPGAALFLIWEGKVAIELETSGRRTLLTQLEKGHFLGEMALLDESPRSATARALTMTKTLALYRNDLKRLIQSDPGTACLIYRSLARIIGDRLRSTNELVQNEPKSLQSAA